MAVRSSDPSSATLPAEGHGAGRPTASADASRAAEQARIRAMSTVERMKLALAAHPYPRATADLDLALPVPPTELARLAATLRAEGWEVVVREPDGNDPPLALTLSRPFSVRIDPAA